MEVKRQKKFQAVSIPEDIMFDIFLRLPTPTLFQCRLVSKDWYSFIKNPVFIDLHKSQIQKDGPRFVLSTWYNKHLYLSDNKLRKSTCIKLINDLSKKEKVEVVGSSNGLLCLCISTDRDSFYVCNPLTNEVIRLCKPPHERTDGIFRYTPDGFAYDETTKTYKVFHTWCCDKSLYRTGIEIYDLGTCKWRMAKEEYIPSYVRQKSSQVVSNGALHWEIAESTESLEINRRCIGAIHIESEIFWTIEAPSKGEGITTRTLGSLKGRLCVMDVYMRSTLTVWSMREYGDERSWYQEYDIRRRDIRPFGFSQTFQTVEETTILVGSSNRQGYYDPEKKELKQTEIRDIWSQSLEVFHHVGSLVSPRPKRFKTKG
ncbi:hypothetical protein ACHQM5_018026 [Ranunculus cassubicifolius]